jgi:Undecaprenyl-phosphate glucose phosphotransferase
MGNVRYLRSTYLFIDFLLLNITFCSISFYFKWPNLTADPNFLAQFIYINIIWLLTCSIVKVHELDRGMRFEQILSVVIRAVSLFTLMLISVLYIFSDYVISVYHAEVKIVAWVMVFITWRTGMAYALNHMRRKGKNIRKVMIVGNGQAAFDMMRFLQKHPETGYKLAGVFCDETHLLKPEQVTGKISHAKEFASANQVDEIFCSLSGLEASTVTDMMNFADNNMLRFKVIPDFRGFLNRKVNVDFYGLVPVLSMRNEPLQLISNQILKRTFDIVFSLLVLLLVFPIAMLLFAPLIKFSSSGPVFFRQLRAGRDKREFYCYKFRTMKVNADADSVQATEGDVRITPIGAFLRKTSLDELPQFFNVLIGNMSVVGPRPHMLKQSEEYARLVNKYMVRQLVKPGVTGWLQIHGFRGDSRSHELMEKRVEYDVWYVENWSLLLDIKIVLITAWQVLTGRNKGY